MSKWEKFKKFITDLIPKIIGLFKLIDMKKVIDYISTTFKKG
jgi:hypothetical protein